MTIRSILNFTLKLIWSKKSRSFLISFSIMIGTAVLFIFFLFSRGMENAMIKPISEIAERDTLLVKADALSFLFASKNKIDQNVVDQITDFPETAKVSRRIFLPFFSAIRTNLFWLTIDPPIPVFGVDEDFIKTNNPELVFKEQNNIIPIALSPRLLDLFNAEVANQTNKIPALDPEILIGKDDIEIFFGEVSPPSNTKGQKGKIVTITPLAPALGIAIPMSTAFEAAKKYRGIEEKDLHFSTLLVKAKSVDEVFSLQKKINDMGFIAKTFEEIGEEVLSLTFALKMTLIIASGLVIFIALISLFSMISISVMEQKQTIGILRSIGASKLTVILIFLFEGLLLGAGGAIAGLIIGSFSSLILDAYLLAKIPDISLKPDTFFPFSVNIFIEIFIIICLLSLLAAFLPAKNSIKQEPLEAILK